MNTKWILVAAAVCLFIVFAAGSLVWTPTAQGQLPAKGSGLEYKVATFYGSDGDKRQSEKLNTLAADGWEYAGVVNQNSERNESAVAFKRLKK